MSWAQSLVDVAKKEKERRSKLEKGDDARVITDRELSTGRLPASFPVTADNVPMGESGESSAASEPSTEEGEESGEDQTKTREYWQQRVDAVKKKIQDLEAKLQAPDMNWGEGIRNDVNPVGQKNLSQRQDVESELAKARAELRGIQEEARRAGVPPGWVR